MVASVASSSSIYSDHAQKPCIDIFDGLGIKILPNNSRHLSKESYKLIYQTHAN